MMWPSGGDMAQDHDFDSTDLRLTELVDPDDVRIGDFFWGVSEDPEDEQVMTNGRRIDGIKVERDRGSASYTIDCEGRTAAFRTGQLVRVQKRGLAWERVSERLDAVGCPTPPIPEQMKRRLRIEGARTFSSLPYLDVEEAEADQDARLALALGEDPQDLAAVHIGGSDDDLRLSVLVVAKPVAVFVQMAAKLDHRGKLPRDAVRGFREAFSAMGDFLNDGELMGAHPSTWYVFDCDLDGGEVQLIEPTRWGSVEGALENRDRFGSVAALVKVWDGIRSTPVACGKDVPWPDSL